MIADIITLIIHESNQREATDPAFKLNNILLEINLIIHTMVTDLLNIRQMQISEETKNEMRAHVLTSHKS